MFGLLYEADRSVPFHLLHRERERTGSLGRMVALSPRISTRWGRPALSLSSVDAPVDRPRNMQGGRPGTPSAGAWQAITNRAAPGPCAQA